MKRRVIITLLIATLVATPLIALWAIGYSEAALRYVVSKIPSKFGTIERFAVKDVEGSVAGGLRIGAIDIEHDIVRVELRDIRVRIDLLPLVWQTIEARELSVGSVVIIQLPRDRPPPNKPPRFLPQLLTVDARSAKLPLIEIRPMSGNPFEFRDSKLDGLLRSTTLSVRSLRTRFGGMQLDVIGVLTAAIPLALEGELSMQYEPRRGPRWTAKGDFDGDLAEARFDLNLLEPFGAKIDEGNFRLLSPWNVRGAAAIKDLDLRRFGGSEFLGLISGTLDLTLDRDGYRAKGSLLPPGLRAGNVDLDFAGRYSRGVLTAERIELHHPSAGTRVNLAGTFTATESGLLLALGGDWQQLRWPLTGPAPGLTSRAARFTLRGDGPYEITVAGEAQIGSLPVIDADVAGSLQPGRVELANIEARALDGIGKLSGQVAWKPAESWQLTGDVRGLNPGRVRAALPGKLNFSVKAQGRGFGERGVTEIQVRQLTGELRGTPARGSGELRLANSVLQFSKVDFSAGGLRLALDGAVSQHRNDFKFRIEADDLGVLAAGGKGRLRASGSLRGTPTSMLVKIEAQGRDLSLNGVEVDRLAADVDLDPGGASDTVARALIEASNVRAFGRKADRIRINVDGRTSAHSLSVDLQGPEIGLKARGQGNFDGAGWRQRWSDLDLQLTKQVALTLEQPLGLLLTTNSLAADAFCLRGIKGSLLTDISTVCGSGAVSAAAWNVEATVSRLPIASLLPKPAARAQYDGSLSASLNLRSAEGPLAYGSVRADFEGAALRWQRAGGQSDLIPLGSGSLQLDSKEDGLIGQLDVTAGDRGRARGELRATPLAANWRGMPLTATVRADSSALALLYLYVPEIDRSAGDLSLDLVVGGTLGTPLVNGVLRLENGELDFYQFNLALREIRAEARLIDNGFVLNSGARIGRGSVEANAELNWRSGQPYGELKLRGKDLLVIDVPEARISASPDLRFKVAGRNLEATGTVHIPSARIVPADLTGAVLTSADEILVGAEPPDPQGSFRVSSALRLTLGDAVTVDSFGLSGRLAGALNVSSTAEGVNRGSGELSIAEGKYAALGRRLDIERGRLIFSGGLLNDPGVEIRATKEFPDVRAGVNVRGTLREPRMTFFSEPSLPQSQVVSLILAGGTLESTQNGNIAGSGRDAILAQGGAILAQQIGQRIGIEDVGIEQNLANETSLVFGKYLSSRLYVSYGVSLAEAINTLKLRYSINDRWTLRTEAGKEASAEVVYTVEKN